MNIRVFTIVLVACTMTTTLDAQLLWKITGGGSKTSYLFGTHHLIEQNQINHFDSILSICAHSDIVIGESDMTDPTMQNKMIEGCKMNNCWIKDLVCENDYKMLDAEFMKVLGAGMNTIGNMKPIMLDALYTVFIYMKSTGLKHQPEAIDLILQKKAKELGKAVVPLENIEDQIMALFCSIPIERQVQILVQDIKDAQKDLIEIKQLNNAYLAGDLNKMNQINKNANSMTPDEMKFILENRTDKWMKQLPTFINSQSCFIAVGALHLAGNNGIIARLQQQGYKVEPVVF
jgi:uncharacterized protein